jgi:hypothetical protein
LFFYVWFNFSKEQKMPSHKDLCIHFTIVHQQGNRTYEAVGFLNEGESCCLGTEMLERVVDKNGGAINEEEETFLLSQLQQLPAELRPYWLVTKRPCPGNPPRNVSCFACNEEGRWYRFWDWLGYGWFEKCLVLRRCP